MVKKGGRTVSNNIERIKKGRQQWEEKVSKPALDSFGLKESPTEFCTPADTEDFDFLGEVGFPGEYPFTAGIYAAAPGMPAPRVGRPIAPGRGGPSLAFAHQRIPPS